GRERRAGNYRHAREWPDDLEAIPSAHEDMGVTRGKSERHYHNPRQARGLGGPWFRTSERTARAVDGKRRVRAPAQSAHDGAQARHRSAGARAAQHAEPERRQDAALELAVARPTDE